MAQEIVLTSKSVQAIMTKRGKATKKDIGKLRFFTIQGNGSTVDVTDKAGNVVQSVREEGTVFQKRIFNLKANSEVAMMNPRNIAILKAALSAEKAGKPVSFDLAGNGEKKEYTASQLFNAYLNKVQLSFNIPLPSAKVDQFADGVEIAAKVQLITTDNGELLTLDPSSARLVAPETLAATNFDITAFMSEDTDKPAVEETEEPKEQEKIDA